MENLNTTSKRAETNNKAHTMERSLHNFESESEAEKAKQVSAAAFQKLRDTCEHLHV